MIAGSGVTLGQAVVAVAVFTVIADPIVLVPVVVHLLARQQMAPVLTRLREWLEQNNATVMSVLLLVIGMVLVGKDIGALG